MRALKAVLPPLVLAVLALIIYDTRISHQMTDFGVYHTAADRAAAAAPLYRESDGHYQFKYLPAFAVAVLPLHLVDVESAKALWFGASVALLVMLVRWSVRALPERRLSETVLRWLTVLLMAKFFGHELTLGQANSMLGAMLVAALLALQIDLPILAAVLIGLAAFVKPYALIALPWLGATRGAKPALVAVGVVAFGLLLPATIYGWSGNLSELAGWYHTVTTSTAPNLMDADNISLAAMWAKWIGPSRLAAALATTSAGVLLAVMGGVWLGRREVSDPDYLDFAMLMLAVPLLSPQGWDYVLLLATPAVVCTLDRWQELAPTPRALVTIALVTMCLTMFGLMGRTLYGRFMALSLVSLAALGLVATLAHLRWRQLA